MMIELTQEEVERAVLDLVERKLAVQERPKIGKLTFVVNRGSKETESELFGKLTALIEVEP